MKKERILYLDLIRIICFLMVTAYHFAVAVKAFEVNADVAVYQEIRHIAWAPIAVSCFFMVSGAALIHRYQDRLSWRAFYKQRFLGIYPLFWLAYVLAFLDFFYRTKLMPQGPRIHFLLSVIAMDGYMNDYIPTFYMVGEWFLGAIVLMYLLFPLYRIVMLKCKYVLPAVFLAASVWLLYRNPFPMVIEKNPIVCSMYFTLGMLIEMLRQNLNKKAGTVVRRIAAVIGLSLFVTVYVAERMGYQFNAYHAIFMLAVSLYMIVMEIAEWITGERVRALIRTISRHSYSYFLLHHVILCKYVLNFSGVEMDTLNTLLLFGSAVVYIYVLAVGLDKFYAYLVRSFLKWRGVHKQDHVI